MKQRSSGLFIQIHFEHNRCFINCFVQAHFEVSVKQCDRDDRNPTSAPGGLQAAGFPFSSACVDWCSAEGGQKCIFWAGDQIWWDVACGKGVNYAKNKILANIRTVLPGKEYTQYSLHNVHLQYPWVMELTRHPQVLRVASAILGPDVILLDSRFICKYPTISPDGNNGKDGLPYVAWHQDMR